MEVSSDGQSFFRFPSYSLTSAPVGSFSSIDPTNINGLAGKYRGGYGTPFDLSSLAGQSGLDVNNVRYVRIVDIVGKAQLSARGSFTAAAAPELVLVRADGKALSGDDVALVVSVTADGKLYLNSDTAALRLQASREELAPWIDGQTRLVAADRLSGEREGRRSYYRLSDAAQTRLARVLDTRSLRRTGSNLSITVNFRLVSATCADLASLGLRADFFHQIGRAHV